MFFKKVYDGSLNLLLMNVLAEDERSETEIDELKRILDGHSALGVNTQNNVVSKQVPAARDNGIEIQSIQGQTFKGKVMRTARY
ncbi:Hypothetical protein DEACI_3012 [Acididesulfobacillus acetoxydans]|uniref:Uncharacterized protein n=1 Tax=Acididesulfobacillus acetoxydans TaxID=1561005 RepID=A0A8S0W4E0_9FIRM|nr:Hypothetical protein DEACI_3012 [Acididesulfobacillus acetoxydans]CEJ08427.1 Hypothetical protein DEACI_2903 [Acididesulfobacillus acetoxydans]